VLDPVGADRRESGEIKNQSAGRSPAFPVKFGACDTTLYEGFITECTKLFEGNPHKSGGKLFNAYLKEKFSHGERGVRDS
jgi:hypothetical protein